jgi:YfiH family protein
MTHLPVYQAKQLKSHPTIKHGFFSRQGGVSSGHFTSLNMALSKTDQQKNVLANHDIVGKWFGINSTSVFTAQQDHTSQVLVITEFYSKFHPPQADALITSIPKLAIGVLTADCVPILVYAPQAKLISAIHAGWKGAKAGIITNTIATLEALGAQRSEMIAAIGPAIFQDSYEVDDVFYQEFLTEHQDNRTYFKSAQREGHYLFNLPSYVIAKLKAERISQIERIELDTYQNDDLFFSYRRACHRGESDFGNQISAIMLA